MLSWGVIRKSIRQNRLPFLALTLSFFFFLGAVLYGGRLIYRMEAHTLASGVTSALARDARTLREFFIACRMDLLSMRQIPGLATVLSSDGSGHEQDHAVNVLLAFARAHPHYTHIRIMDRRGRERIAIDNSGHSRPMEVAAGGRHGRDEDFRNLLALRPGKEGVLSFFFFHDLDNGTRTARPPAPEMVLAAPLPGPGATAGIIVLHVSAGSLLEQLSPGTFLQTDRGQVLLSRIDKPYLVRGAPYPFTGRQGSIALSDTESIHYTLVEYLPGFRVWLAGKYTSAPFKASMIKLETVFVSILAAFFLFVLLVGFFSMRQIGTIGTIQKAIIHSLANLSEWRDPETGSHLERTRNFSVLLARALHRQNPGLGRVITEDFLEALYDAVPLHDVGKVGIPDHILLKPARLNDEEFAAMKRHVLIGQEVIQGIMNRFRLENQFLTASRNICYYHHEKYDGSGYPEGLKGDDIPLEARIFAVCDVYDALRARRPYKPGLSHEEAVSTITADSGKQFDPDVVAAFLSCSEKFYEMFEVYRLFDETYGKLKNVRSNDALKIAWCNDLSVGDATIDGQHMEFVKHVNHLFAAILRGEGKTEALREIAFLLEYAGYHFGSEEAFMKEHAYPGLAAHREEHQTFIRNLAAIRKDVKSADEIISSALVVRINANVVEWLTNHLITSDSKFAGYLKSHRCT